MFECSNILECYNKNKRKIVRSSLLFLVFCIKRSFIIWVAKFNLTVFYMIKTGICMHKSVELFEYFSKNLPSTIFFLCETDIVYFSIFDYSKKFLQAKPIISIAWNGWNDNEIFNIVRAFLTSALLYLKH